MRVKLKTKITALCCMLLFIMVSISGLLLNVKALAETESPYKGNFSGYSEGMSVSTLHEKTILKGMVEDDPSMTVLVPGQGGEAYHWSSKKVTRVRKVEKNIQDENGEDIKDKDGNVITEIVDEEYLQRILAYDLLIHCQVVGLKQVER